VAREPRPFVPQVFLVHYFDGLPYRDLLLYGENKQLDVAVIRDVALRDMRRGECFRMTELCVALGMLGVLGLLGFPSRTLADDVADARAALAELGIRPTTTNLALESEAKLHKELGRAPAIRRTLTQTEKGLQNAEAQVAKINQGLTTLKQQYVLMSARLATIDPNNVTLNNQLVGALNANQGQRELGEQQRDRLEEQVKTARGKLNEVREQYLQFVLDMRKLADTVEADYQAHPRDPAALAAIETYNAAAPKPLALAPTTALPANLRRLKQLEDSALSEAIELNSDGGTLKVNVVVDGKHQQEMVVDSGASLISLPLAVAAKFGLRPTSKDEEIILQLADGRQIRGHKMTIPSVRVGKFTVEMVECAVLGEEAINAEPLLGMSSLENFKFEIDAGSRKLTMVKVGE
jgi:clan AA aspartic protease (TIGR02281 family)